MPTEFEKSVASFQSKVDAKRIELAPKVEEIKARLFSVEHVLSLIHI